MLDQFEVADLPFKDVVVLRETETLKKAADQLRAKGADLVVITEVEGLIKGVVSADTLVEIAEMAPDGPLSNLSLLTVVEVSGSAPFLEAIRLVSKIGVGALAVRRQTGEIKLLSRAALIDFNAWSLLLKARDRRIASALPAATLH